jgi:hypothetical protein
MTSIATASPRLGMIGSIVGLLALIAAVLPLWVVPIMFPPEPINQVIVDIGHSVKERLVARAKGVEYQAPRREKSTADRLSQGFSTAAVALGLLAIVFAVFSQIFREEKLLAGISATLGVFAIAVEISFIVIGALVLIAIVHAVTNYN